MENVENYLRSFGKYVVQQARSNLTKGQPPYGNKNVDKKLYNSINFKLVNDGDNLTLQFSMLDYGQFVDKGVSGNKKIQSYTTWDKRKIESPFKYRSKGPPIDIISKWIKKRGIAPKGLGKARSKGYTSKSGKKVKGTGQYISPFAYLVSRKIKRDGIKSLSFFQRPLGLGMEKFGGELLKAVKQDVLNGLTTVK